MVRRYLTFFIAVIGFSFFLTKPSLTQLSVQKKNLHPVPVESPKKGIFLVASPNMSDPRFHRSVILLLAHDENGSLGLIINRPTTIPLAEAVPEFQSSDQQNHLLFFGGPVAMDTLIFLIRGAAPTDNALPVLDDIYASGDAQILEQLLNTDKTQPMRIYFGHAGWAPGQLDAELARNGWYLFQAEPETVFHNESDILWESFMEEQQDPLMLVRNNTNT